MRNGDTLRVDSFFDVFFDVTLTDVDTRDGRNYAGQGDDGVIQLLGLGPANMQFSGDCIADLTKDNFGCLPPTGDAYIGHLGIMVDLSAVFFPGGTGKEVDINGNGHGDLLSFTFATHSVGGITQTFIDQNGDLVESFMSTLDLEGALADKDTDPPFTISLTGPTTARQQILVPAAAVPEPGTFLLLGTGLIALLGYGWRRTRAA